MAPTIRFWRPSTRWWRRSRARRSSRFRRANRGSPEEVLERIQSVGGVRAAAPVIEASVETGFRGQGKLLILGVDMTGDRSLREYDFDNAQEDVIDDPLVFLA